MVKFYDYLGNPALSRLLKVSPAVYPHLNDFSVKVDTLNLESQNQAKNIPVGLPSSPIKIWGKSIWLLGMVFCLQYSLLMVP